MPKGEYVALAEKYSKIDLSRGEVFQVPEILLGEKVEIRFHRVNWTSGSPHPCPYGCTDEKNRGRHTINGFDYYAICSCSKCHRSFARAYEGLLEFVIPGVQPPDPKLDGKQYKKEAAVWAVRMDKDFTVDTLEGVMQGRAGDYLCEGLKGERWPVKGDIFEATYKPVAS